MFTYRCSSDVDDEADKESSTSPPPSHACETISEEYDETANGMTTTAAPTADGQEDTERQVGSSQLVLPRHLFLILSPLQTACNLSFL